jgi:hypothetical protein
MPRICIERPHDGPFCFYIDEPIYIPPMNPGKVPTDVDAAASNTAVLQLLGILPYLTSGHLSDTDMAEPAVRLLEAAKGYLSARGVAYTPYSGLGKDLAPNHK